MEYLQYFKLAMQANKTFKVLNLIINGIPSIHAKHGNIGYINIKSFKPYYKWNTFNTKNPRVSYASVMEF